MSFDFEINADPSKALRWIAQVEKSLAGVEASAKDASGKFVAMGEAADRAGRQASNAMDYAAQRARATASATENAFAGVVGQLRKEHEMLERIHGPMRQLESDMRTLDMLQQKGQVSAAQYARELERIGRAAGITPRGNPMNAVSLPSVPSAPVGGLGGLGGGAVGLLAKVGGAAMVAREVYQLADTYQTLQNRIRTVTSTEAEMNGVMEKTRAIANSTRSEWASTTEGFVRMTNATKQMGLTQDHVLRLTSQINKAIIVSGATSTEAAAGMIQLSQGLASGALRGDELRSVLEQLPGVADVIAQGMGVTRGQLRALGADGKITAEVIVDAFDRAGATLDEKFNKTVPTMSQHWVVFKNELTDVVGKMVEASGVTNTIGDAFGTVMAIVRPLAAMFIGAGNAVGWLKDKLEMLGPLAGPLSMLFKPFGYAKDLIVGLTGSVQDAVDAHNKLGDELKDIAEKLRVQSIEIAYANSYFMTMGKTTLSVADGISAISKSLDVLGSQKVPDMVVGLFGKLLGHDAWDPNKVKNELEKQAAILEGLRGSRQKYHEEVDRLNKMLSDGLIDRTEFDRRRAEMDQGPKTKGRKGPKGPYQMTQADLDREYILGLPADVAQGYANVQKDLSAGMRELLDLQKMFGDEAKRQAKERHEHEMAHYKARKEQHEKELAALKQIKEATGSIQQQFETALIGQATQFSDVLVDAAFGADISWRQFFRNMAIELSKVIAQALVLRALTGSFTGAIGAGGEGKYGGLLGALGSIASSGAWSGMATGGSWTVGGHGGTDTVPVAFRATPGERITVETQDDQRNGRRGDRSTMATFRQGDVHIHQSNDKRDLLGTLNSRDGDQEILNVIRRNHTAVNTITRGR